MSTQPQHHDLYDVDGITIDNLFVYIAIATLIHPLTHSGRTISLQGLTLLSR